ncbi:MAG: Ig [archaeon GW2011_AR21]|nr:MAG: Ig [archaeon GW2011_AR21]
MRILFFIAILLILIVFISGCAEKPVENINNPPVLNPIGNKIVNKEDTVTFTINASDPDNDSLTYSASNLPGNATFNTVTQTFSWTPTYAEGSYQVTFAVNDGSLSDNESITIIVKKPVEKPEKALAAELGLPEGYNAEFLLKPGLLSPLFIAATSDDQLLVAEHYGNRLLRINPLTAEIEVLYNLPRERNVWNALLSDGADGAYMQIMCQIVHISGNGTYTVYYPHCMNPAALGPNGEIYGYTKSDVLVLQSKDEEPKTIATGFSTITDLVRDKEGNLYVSDWDLGTITRIKPDGTKQLLSSALNQKDPIELGFAPDGTLYADEGIGKFSQIDTNSGTLNKINWFGGTDSIHPTDFTFLSNGKAYFVDPTHNNIMRVDLQKEEVELVIRGGGNSRALDVGPDGAVYIGESNGYPFYSSKILRIQPDGSSEVYAENLDAIIDLSFALNGNMFVVTRYRRGMECGGSSVLLVTPEHEVRTLKSWNCLDPGARGLWSISVDPKTGLAVAYDEGNSELVSVDENGDIAVLPNSFSFDTKSVYLDHAPDGTLYATETNKKNFETGPLVERNIIRFDDNGNPKIVADFNHIGCCTTENIAISPNGTIYVIGYKLEGNDMSLWRVTNEGEKILLSDKLPIDPLAIAIDVEDNIYLTSSAGLLKIWK